MHFDTLTTVEAGAVGVRKPFGVQMIVQVGGDADYLEAEANARLIAAAPDLLECLAYALEMLEFDRITLRECHTGPDGHIDPHDAEMCDELDAVARRFRASIAKATGEAA